MKSNGSLKVVTHGPVCIIPFCSGALHSALLDIYYPSLASDLKPQGSDNIPLETK